MSTSTSSASWRANSREEHCSKIALDKLLDLPHVAPPMNPSTVYITVVDEDRNVCSFINSIAHSFGSAIVSEQDRRPAAESRRRLPRAARPPELHRAEASGRCTPSSRRSPPKAAARRMSFGVMGGQYQPVGQVHVLTNMLDYGLDVQEAIDLPRGLHYESVYQLEDGVPAATVEGLKALGHKVAPVGTPHGGGQAIWIDWDKGTLTGGSDPRKDGCALGY